MARAGDEQKSKTATKKAAIVIQQTTDTAGLNWRGLAQSGLAESQDAAEDSLPLPIDSSAPLDDPSHALAEVLADAPSFADASASADGSLEKTTAVDTSDPRSTSTFVNSDNSLSSFVKVPPIAARQGATGTAQFCQRWASEGGSNPGSAKERAAYNSLLKMGGHAEPGEEKRWPGLDGEPGTWGLMEQLVTLMESHDPRRYINGEFLEAFKIGNEERLKRTIDS